MVKKLLHTRYRVTDLEKTVSFYKDVLGLKETARHTSGRGSQLVFLKAPESDEELELCKFDQSGPVVVGHGPAHVLRLDGEAHGIRASAAGPPRRDRFFRSAGARGARDGGADLLERFRIGDRLPVERRRSSRRVLEQSRGR
jgi:lactoylglutathione lyase